MRRRPSHRGVALLAVGAIVLGACGGDDGDTGDASALPGAAADGSGQAPTATGVAGDDGTSTSAPGGAPGTVAPQSTQQGSTGPTTAPARAYPASLDVGGVGAFAPALLRPDLSERLIVEVHADAEPRAATLDHLAAVLADVSGKPVSVVAAGAPGGGDRSWSAASLRQAADAGSTTGQGGGVAVVRLLFVHGSFEGDDGVLGVAVRGDVAAVFVDRVADAAGLLGASDGIEVAVTTHELGHLLGLVDLYLDTGRADPDHPGHSTNPDSVMYWAVETDLVGQLLGANPPRHFDADDLADLASIRAGA